MVAKPLSLNQSYKEKEYYRPCFSQSVHEVRESTNFYGNSQNFSKLLPQEAHLGSIF